MTTGAAARHGTPPATEALKKPKLHGRAFYESIGSPKYILAPMVDQSEFAWRLLSRSFLPPSERAGLLAYSPMLHARLFADNPKYRDAHFQPTRSAAATCEDAVPGTDSPSSPASAASVPDPFLDGNPVNDRPLFVQFCANDPDELLAAAQRAAPHCDAVDLNLGCPQGIARKGHYGAFLQEDGALVHALVRTLHERLPVPVTAKIRVLDTPEATLAHARNVLDAGASILTVHGRRRDQKGHLTGLADWAAIRHLRDQLPADTVLFANGNVLEHADLRRCLDATGADGVMAAEGNLSNPALFAPEPGPGLDGGEYWRGRDGRGGWRVDAVMRRYLDILHRHVLGREPPARRPLFVPGDDPAWVAAEEAAEAEAEPARKKRKLAGSGGNGNKSKKGPKDAGAEAVAAGPNFSAAQPHLFHLLRHLVSRHTDVRDVLARTRGGDVAGLERVLRMVEHRVAAGLAAYEDTGGASVEEDRRRAWAGRGAGRGKGKEGEEGAVEEEEEEKEEEEVPEDELTAETSIHAVRRCWRPWWVVQPIVRPLPKEALAKGSITLSKKKGRAQPRGGGEEGREARAAGPPTETAGGGQHKPAAVESLEKATSFPVSEAVSG